MISISPSFLLLRKEERESSVMEISCGGQSHARRGATDNVEWQSAQIENTCINLCHSSTIKCFLISIRQQFSPLKGKGS